MNEAINIWSEIGTLRRVLVHRPGEELLNLMPEHLDRLLFDDIPYLRLARQEHDRFAQLLTEQGVEVVYLEDLVAESLTEESIRRQLVEEYLRDAGIRGEKRIARMMEYFLGFSTKNMVLKMMAGVRKSEIYGYGKKNLTDYLEGDHYFQTQREGQNLDRCRTQFKLVADMEKKWDIMQEIVAKYNR